MANPPSIDSQRKAELANLLSQKAEAIFGRRDRLGISELIAEKEAIAQIRKDLSKMLSPDSQPTFNANMDMAEDVFVALIRGLRNKKDTEIAFAGQFRELLKYLKAASDVVWAFSPMVFSIFRQ